MTKQQTKAELQAENEVLKQQIEELTKPKSSSDEFNYFEYFKFVVLKEFFTKKMKGENTDEVTFVINYDRAKSNFFYKSGALKFVKWNEVPSETGKLLYEITVKDIDLDAKAKTKTGKEFNIFKPIDISKAVKSAMKALA